VFIVRIFSYVGGRVEGKTVKVTVVLSRVDRDRTQFSVEGNPDDSDALAAKIVEAILEASDTAPK
jgi:predicted thioesterase